MIVVASSCVATGAVLLFFSCFVSSSFSTRSSFVFSVHHFAAHLDQAGFLIQMCIMQSTNVALVNLPVWVRSSEKQIF